MATRHRLDHDLDPNQHRMLGARGADLTITAGGDLTMGACNYANVTPAGGILRRVQTIDWTQGSTISFRTTTDLTIQHGAGAGSGFVGIATPDGLPFVAKAGDVVSLTLDGAVWCLPRASGDTYRVGATSADAAAGKAGYLEKKAVGDGITVTTAVRTDATEGEQVVISAMAQADPISFASTLYAAHLDDLALFSSVTCAFYKVVGGGANFVTSFNPDYTEWEEIRPGVFKSTIAGQGSIRDYIPEGITPVAGMRVASVNPTEYPMNFAYDEIRTGVYIITNPGYTGTIGEPGYSVDYAVLERAPELDATADFANGCVFQVNQGLGAGKYFRMTNTQPIVLGTTELTWEVLDSYTATASDNLLTAAQLARASETPNTTALVASLNTPSEWLKLPTLTGTPNLDTYKAGRTEAQVLARLHVAGETGSITWLECLVVRDPGGDDITLETINTSPITNPTDEVIKAFIDDATDRDLAGDRIGLWIRARSDSTTPAAIAVTWSDPAHSTRLLTPLSLAVGGTDDHQALTAVSRGFAADGAAARAYRHPMASIESGLITWNTGPTVATVDGLLTLPPKTNAVRISGTETLLGIATTGMTPGTVIYVEMESARPIATSGSTPTGYAALNFYNSFGFTATPAAFFAPSNAAMVLELSGADTWRVLSAPWVEPVRALWPSVTQVEINSTTAPGLLELPDGCAGTIYVTGTELRAITWKNADDIAQAGPLAALKLHFESDCTLYHLSDMSEWDEDLAARAVKLDLLPPDDASGDEQNIVVRSRRTMRLVLNYSVGDFLWVPEVSQ